MKKKKPKPKGKKHIVSYTCPNIEPNPHELVYFIKTYKKALSKEQLTRLRILSIIFPKVCVTGFEMDYPTNSVGRPKARLTAEITFYSSDISIVVKVKMNT